MTQSPSVRLLTEANAATDAADPATPLGAALSATVATSVQVVVLPPSNGTNDTTQLNAKLAAGGRFRARVGENYKLDGPLVLPSNTELDATGATFTKLASAVVNIGGTNYANCLMLINKNCFTGRFVQDGVMTLSGTNLQSATAAFTSADVGKNVRVWEAGDTGANPRPLDTTITAVIDGQNATLATAALAAVTSAPVHIGERDTDITVKGGYWVRNYATAPQGNPAWMYAHGIQTRHADRVTLDGMRHLTLGNKYMTNLGDGTHLTVTNQICDTASDGVHFTGPARHVVVRNIFGKFQDDAVAFCTGEIAYGNGTGDTQGNIYDVLVDNVTRSGTQGGAFKIAGSSYGYTHKRFTVRKITNNSLTGNTVAAYISGDTGAPVTDELVFEDLFGSNIVSSGTHGTISFNNAKNNSANYSVQVFNGATIKDLRLRGINRTPGLADITPIYIYGAGTSVDVVTASDSRWPVGGSFLLVNTSATVGKAYLSNVAYVPPTNSGVLVSSQASCTIGSIHAAGCRSDGAYGFEIMNGTTDLTIGGGTYYQTLHAGATATVSVFGAWEQTNAGNLKDSGGVIRSWAPSWRCNANDLTADTVGNSITNRNSGLSCGIGPVTVVATNKWQHAITGAVYAPAGPSTVAVQAGAGTGATASLTGTDGGGTITVTAGTATAAGSQVTMNFLTGWGATPKSVIITPTNAAAQAAGLYLSAKAAGSFTVSASNAPAVSTAMTFDFMVRL